MLLNQRAKSANHAVQLQLRQRNIKIASIAVQSHSLTNRLLHDLQFLQSMFSCFLKSCVYSSFVLDSLQIQCQLYLILYNSYHNEAPELQFVKISTKLSCNTAMYFMQFCFSQISKLFSFERLSRRSSSIYLHMLQVWNPSSIFVSCFIESIIYIISTR